jgi:hypothetical protein
MSLLNRDPVSDTPMRRDRYFKDAISASVCFSSLELPQGPKVHGVNAPPGPGQGEMAKPETERAVR